MTITLPDGWKFTQFHDERGKLFRFIETIGSTCAVAMDGGMEVGDDATTAQFFEAIAIAKQIRGIVDARPAGWQPTIEEMERCAFAHAQLPDQIADTDQGKQSCIDLVWPPIPPIKEAT